jgi:hypothetical protein
MSNKRIDLTRWHDQVEKEWKPDERQDHLDDLKTLLYKLEECYEEIDSLRECINDAHKVMLKYANEEY